MKPALAAAALTLALASSPALAQQPPQRGQPMPVHRGGPGMPGPGRFAAGIPPHVAVRVGISEDLQKRIRQMSFEANEQLINLEADLKRAKLELQKQLTADKPNQGAVMAQVDRVARAEAEVRKNRLGLLLRVREALGPELWKKLEAEMPMERMKMRKLRGGHGPLGQLEPLPPPEEFDPEFDD